MTSDAFVSSHPSTIQAIEATMKMMKPATVTRAFMLAATSEAARKWAPAFENYTFNDKNGATEVLVDMDVEDEHVQMFNEMWPKGLRKLKELAEK